ncbi:EKC/KEOPS complex subunit TP53RK-like [Rhopilema esculentum]|uniref:EKC/KEOPS complex subunit TP53RK-like n=1 Tax=Rhopilema esculentum TaxID=499914 RepID=UPI0031D77F76
MELIKQGAEAKVFKVEYLGKQAIVKQRFRKTYRHPSLDEKLTHRRTLQEVRSMLRCRKSGIRTPVVYHLDNETHSIYMEEITGAVTARDFINSLLSENSKTSLHVALEDLARKMGETIARMHEADVVHGDLTTSNMLIQTNGTTESLIIIDFGLSFISTLAEDKGVDLYVLERAFLSTHPNTEDIFRIFLKSYVTSSTKKSSQAVIAKLDEVRMRGRKRVMIG